MKEDEKGVFKEHKYSSKKIKIIFIVLILILIIFLVYILFIKSKNCKNEECFFNSLKSCKKTYFLNEDSQYSWAYFISKQASADSCEVKVRLMSIKKNSIDLRVLQNKEMTCIIPKKKADFPEKDISKCSGVLKENLQDLIIQRMYDYLLTNVQEINISFLEPL
jgi:hypothetical protein